VYYVRYIEQADNEKEKGFLSGLFSKKPSAKPTRHQIKVLSSSEQNSLVQVLNENGQPESNSVSERILGILASDLR
jgi:uncharacterized lipoprotein